MSNKQEFSHLRLVQAIAQLPKIENPAPPMIGMGRVWGFRDSSEALLIIQLANGVHFTCELTDLQRRSVMAQSCSGMAVAFFHRGFDIQGKPIKPSFKTLLPRWEKAPCLH